MTNVLLDMLLQSYQRMYRANFTPQKENWLIKKFCNAAAIFIRYVLRRIIWKMKAPKEKLPEGTEIIVSVSSFPKRFPRLRYMLISVLRQTVKPEHIVVNLTSEECQHGQQDIPGYLRELEQYGVEFKIRQVNLRPHNKYFYTLQEYPSKHVITLDDDVFYRSDVIKRLVDLHNSNPGCVCSNQARHIKKDKDGTFADYSKWDIYNNASCGHHLLALGVGGVLYPAGILRSGEMFNEQSIRDLCLNADDLWLKAHEALNDIKVAACDFTAPNLTLNYGESDTLSRNNVEGGRNNILWGALDGRYKLKDKITPPRQACKIVEFNIRQWRTVA